MSAYIFLGPSLPVEEARRYLPAVYCPPVRQGDILRVLPHRPSVIGIVDGDFDGAPSVWHKEILLAMSQGVHVFGAAAMGALRAAELHSFGMVGIGRVFDSFRTGEVEDDDEVAVTHGSAATGFSALSEAMVDIRDALQAAVLAEVITSETCTRLTGIAKRLHYTRRTYKQILEVARAELGAGRLLILRTFLDAHRPTLTARDTIAMLKQVAALLADGCAPLRVTYTVERTVFLESALREVENEVALAGSTNEAVESFRRARGCRSDFGPLLTTRR